MKRTWITLGLVTATLAFTAGCQSGAQDDGSAARADAVETHAVAEPVEILGQRDGDQGDLPYGGIWLIRSEADLRKANSATIGGLGVDLSEHDIVVVGLGEQPTGGYGVDITAIQQVGDTLYVQVETEAPDVDAAVTQALTNPWAAAVIANTSATKAHADSQ